MALFRRTASTTSTTRATSTEGRFVISGHRSEYLVGTEHYPQVYAQAREGQPALVEFHPEVGNPHDPNAIAGKVGGHVAGYLRQDVAAKYRKALEQAQSLGYRICVSTEFRPRKDGTIGLGWLDIPSAEALKQWLALPPEERAAGFDLQGGKSPNTPRAVGRPG